MDIGVPREIKAQETRVSMPPAAVADLVERGHHVVVERGAGLGSSYLDADYQKAGATLVADAAAVFGAAQIIVKVKEPQAGEIALLGPHHVLFTFLHLAASRELTTGLLASGCTALAYETLEVNRRLPLLEPMSEIAGRMAAIVGAYQLGTHRGGRGVLLSGVPGVAPGRVVVIGGGTAGMNAARIALGIGAEVTVLDVDVERMRFLDLALPGVRTAFSNPANLARLLPEVDLLVGAVLVPGAKAPKLISRNMLRSMPAGSVFVDIAVDQGGCAETTRPTTHDQPTFLAERVVHYCVANMPGAFSHSATIALNNATHPWTALIADRGLAAACQTRPALLTAINTHAGHLTSHPVADAHQLPFTPIAPLLSDHSRR